MAEVSFGEWLKRRRSALGLTQEQLARQINCSTSALRKMEAELRRPSAPMVEQLAKIFNIPQEELKSFLRFARGDWQALSDSAHEDAPWLVSPVEKQTETPKNNLPLQLTSFIGREKERVEIKNLVIKNRLVTLTGSGGVGKTRLSIQTAESLLNDFPNGIWLVELAPFSDPRLVPQAIVNTLGLLEQANRSPETILVHFLKDKQALLILDNCEHLIQAGAALAEALLHACPGLHILATSREALGIFGETLYRVPSLTTPDPAHLAFETLSQYEAVQLFIERAQSGLPDFSMTQGNAHAIARICQHLDGIPLALELAAARVRGLSVEQIAARLDDRFHLLTGGARTVLPRHQTLQALIDWSHDLLTEPERVLLRRLSVFAGGWTLEGAETVCVGDGLESNQILDLLLRLVDKSLVVAEMQEAESRYHMLETIRQYAREKLWAAREGQMMRQRHLTYFVDLAERAEPNLRAFDMVTWLDRLEDELDNIRVALEYALEDDIEAELRLASALLWFWHIRGPRREGSEWLERGLSIEAQERGAHGLTPGRAMIRGNALNASGWLLGMSLEFGKAPVRLEESRRLFEKYDTMSKRGLAYALLGLARLPSLANGASTLLEQSHTLFRQLEDKFGIAECLMFLMDRAYENQDYEQARRFAEEHLAVRKEIGDQDGIASALVLLGEQAFFFEDDLPRALKLMDEGLTLFHAIRNKFAIGNWNRRYGEILLWHGDFERAATIYEKGLAFARDLGDIYLTACMVQSLGVVAWFQGDYAHAAQMVTESLASFREVGHHWLIASSLHALGDIALAQNDPELATQSYEAEKVVGQNAQVELRAFAVIGLGKVAWVRGDYDLATKRFEEGLRMGRETRFEQAMFHALYGLGRVSQSQGNYNLARTFYTETLNVLRQRFNIPFATNTLITYVAPVAYPLAAIALLANMQNEMSRAACLLGAVEALYAPLRFAISAKERAEHDQAIATTRAALGEAEYTTAYEEGKKMTLDEAVVYALEEN